MTIIRKHLEVHGNTIKMNHLQNDNRVIMDVPDDPNNASFKSKQIITGKIGINGTNDVYETLEMPLIN